MANVFDMGSHITISSSIAITKEEFMKHTFNGVLHNIVKEQIVHDIMNTLKLESSKVLRIVQTEAYNADHIQFEGTIHIVKKDM